MRPNHPLYSDLPDSFEERLGGGTAPSSQPPEAPVHAEVKPPFSWGIFIAYFVSFLVIGHYLMDEIPLIAYAYKDLKIAIPENQRLLIGLSKFTQAVPIVLVGTTVFVSIMTAGMRGRMKTAAIVGLLLLLPAFFAWMLLAFVPPFNGACTLAME